MTENIDIRIFDDLLDVLRNPSGWDSRAKELAMLKAATELERFKKGYDRYETVRLLNPRAYQEIWQLNISTEKPFDEIIDELKR